jgi:ankyrin repeat protein
VDCQTNGKYTPLHRCAFYDHPRLASLLCLAGADQTIIDENGETAYDVAITKGTFEVAQILEPMYDNNGKNISGIAYATNNPKHTNFRKEARDALFVLFDLENKS